MGISGGPAISLSTLKLRDRDTQTEAGPRPKRWLGPVHGLVDGGMQCGTLRTKRSRAAMKMLLWPDRIKALKLTNCLCTTERSGARHSDTPALPPKTAQASSHQFNSGFFLVNNLGKSGSQGPHLPPVYNIIYHGKQSSHQKILSLGT